MTTISKEARPFGGILRKKSDEVPAAPSKIRKYSIRIIQCIGTVVVVWLTLDFVSYLSGSEPPQAPGFDATGPMVLRGTLPTTGEVEHGWTDPLAPPPQEPYRATPTSYAEQQARIADREAQGDDPALRAMGAKAIKSAGYWCVRVVNVIPDLWNSDMNKRYYTIYCDDGRGAHYTEYTLIRHYNGSVQLYPS